jgi:hydrogenase maturation protease
MQSAVRLLGLGNEILGDDALGILIARQAEQSFPPEEVEVVSSSESGLHLLDHVVDVERLIVVDTIQTRGAEPGTVYVVKEGDMPVAAGADSLHRMGLFDTLALARRLGLRTAEDVTIIAVEAADCLTVGGEMHPAVAAAMPRVMGAIREMVRR